GELQAGDRGDELGLAVAGRGHAQSAVVPPLIAVGTVLVPAPQEHLLVLPEPEGLAEEVAVREDQVPVNPADGEPAVRRPQPVPGRPPSAFGALIPARWRGG